MISPNEVIPIICGDPIEVTKAIIAAQEALLFSIPSISLITWVTVPSPKTHPLPKVTGSVLILLPELTTANQVCKVMAHYDSVSSSKSYRFIGRGSLPKKFRSNPLFNLLRV